MSLSWSQFKPDFFNRARRARTWRQRINNLRLVSPHISQMCTLTLTKCSNYCEIVTSWQQVNVKGRDGYRGLVYKQACYVYQSNVLLR